MEKEAIENDTSIKQEEIHENKDQQKHAKEKVKKSKKKFYIGYSARVFIYAILFLLLLFSSLLLVYKSIGVDEEKSVTYQESGNVDYKVYLKENDFYNTPYLNSGRTIITRLIDKIELNANYSFAIQQELDIDYSYEVVAKLTIDSNDGRRLFDKDYTLVSKKTEKLKDKSSFNIQETINVDYNYYNDLANQFRSTYGVDTTSNLAIYLRIGKAVVNSNKSISLNNTKEMALSMPLTEKTIDIATTNIPMVNSSIILAERKTGLKNIAFVVIAALSFIISVALLLKALEMLFLMFKKESKYDKFIKKVLKEYDRLIVEVETPPNLSNANIIRIKKFEELLDVRDNLKRPVMYYIVSSHQKCYFYVQSENNYYLMIVKAIDLENENPKEKKSLK